MKSKIYALVVLSILILLIFIGSASAADGNGTDIISIDESSNPIDENFALDLGKYIYNDESNESNVLRFDENSQLSANGRQSNENVLRTSMDSLRDIPLSEESSIWYVNASAGPGGDGKTKETAFQVLKDALHNATDGDTIMIASGTYSGEYNIGYQVDNALTFEKYGDGEAVFDAQGNSGILFLNSPNVNIIGLTFKNTLRGTGSALFFDKGLSNSIINAVFINNSASDSGGALYFNQVISNSIINSTFISNHAVNDGGAIFMHGVDNTIINSIFINNTANEYGGAFYFKGGINLTVLGEFKDNLALNGGAIYSGWEFSNLNVNATFINNTAIEKGGAIYAGSLSDSIINSTFINNNANNESGVISFNPTNVSITGKFINNTGNSVLIFHNSGTGNVIHDSVFLNNKNTDKIIFVEGEDLTVTDSWFGNTAENYNETPVNVGDGTVLENWLFLNATVDSSVIPVGNSTKVKFILQSYKNSTVSDYNASKMDIRLDLTQTLGELDKYAASIGEEILYTANVGGNATVDGKYVNVIYVIRLTNYVKTPTNISIANSTVGLRIKDIVDSGASLNPPEAGNLTYASSNSSVAVVENGKINAVGIGNATITVSFAGNDKYAAAENKTIDVTVTLRDASVSVNNSTLDLEVDDTFDIVATTVPAGLDVTYVPDNSGVVRVDKNGKVTALKEGVATITVKVGDAKIFAENSTSVNITVSRIPTEIIVVNKTIGMEVDDVVDPGVSIMPSGAGNLSFVVSDESVVLVNGYGIVTAVGEGNATVTVSFRGNDKYAPSNATISVVVSKVDFEANVTDNGTTLTVEVPDDATGNVTVIIGNETLVAPIENGTAIFDLSNVPAGDYNATVIYDGDDKYDGFEIAYPISIKKYILTADDLIKYYGGSERFVVNLTDNKRNPIANATVSIYINGKEYNRTTDNNGQAAMGINLNSGEYPVVVSYNGTSINVTVTVLPTVNGTDVVKIFRNGTQYYATFRDSEGNYLKDGATVRFNINGVFYDRQVSGDKGLAKLNINLEQGTYILTAMNPVTGENAANNITVLSTIVENNDITKYYRNGTQYTVKILGADGNPVGKGETVKFNINGVIYERQTNESGIAKLNINLQPGDYVITAEYNGCTVSNNIKVLPILSADNMSKIYGTPDPFVATLVDGQGNPYANQGVTFNINGVFYTRYTNSTGEAKLNINLMPGEYIITSSFNDTSISNKITVKG